MRYQTEAVGETTYLIGSFATGETVTIAVYDLSDGSAVAVDSASCAEIGATGWYRWGTGEITTPATSIKHYLYIMTDSTGDTYAGKLVVGGYVDDIGDSLSVGDIADAVWDESAGDHVVPGSVGEILKNKLLTLASWVGLK